MTKSIFAFGQRGGYIFESSFERQAGRLPQSLSELYRANKAVKTYAVAIGACESYVIIYDAFDNQIYLKSDGIPASLRDWLYAKDRGRLWSTLAVALGPYNNSYLAWNSETYLALNLPQGLEKAIKERWALMKSSPIDAPRIISLGVGSDYIMITMSHAWSWQLNNYPDLKKRLQSVRCAFSDIEDIALNAYRINSYVIKFATGVVEFQNVMPHAAISAASIAQAIQTETKKEELQERRRQAELEAARERAAQEKAAQDRAAREQAMLLQAILEQEARDQAVRERAAMERAIALERQRQVAAQNRAIEEEATMQQMLRQQMLQQQMLRQQSAINLRAQYTMSVRSNRRMASFRW